EKGSRRKNGECFDGAKRENALRPSYSRRPFWRALGASDGRSGFARKNSGCAGPSWNRSQRRGARKDRFGEARALASRARGLRRAARFDPDELEQGEQNSRRGLSDLCAPNRSLRSDSVDRPGRSRPWDLDFGAEDRSPGEVNLQRESRRNAREN